MTITARRRGARSAIGKTILLRPNAEKSGATFHGDWRVSSGRCWPDNCRPAPRFKERAMCKGDDPNCAEFEKHKLDFRNGMAKERRAFLKSSFAATSGAAALATTGISLVSPALAQTSAARRPGQPNYVHLPANADTVHWGYFSKMLKPQVEIEFRRLHHDRDADPSGQRRLRTDDQGRSGRRERVSLDQGEEGRHAARRRTRRRRRPGRAYLHRTGGGSRRRTRRRAGSPHPGRQAASFAPTRNSRAWPSAATRRRTGASSTRT